MDRQSFTYLKLIFVSFLGICSFANAQELVPNGAFNYSESCTPGSLASNFMVSPWMQWSGSPDYYHPCQVGALSMPNPLGGGGIPLFGEGYIGLHVYSTIFIGREFATVELIQPLSEDISYHAEFNVSMMDSALYATKNIGVLFTENLPPLNQSALLDLEAQMKYEGDEFLTDKEDWMKVEGSFTAQGGERFLTIGNFDTDEETDTLFVEGGGVFRPNQPDYWSFSYYYIDGVSVIPDSIYLGVNDFENEEVFDLYPNPTTETLTIETESKQQQELQLYDATGRLVLQQHLSTARQEIGVGYLPRGVYVAVLVKEGVITARRKVLLQ